MKSFRLLSLTIVFFCLSLGSSLVAQDWQLVWQDEFNGTIGGDWVFETGTGSGGWGNDELQYYRRENARVENGALVITARREDFGGQRYTSARLKTQGRKSFRYGRIEARLSVPYGGGFWPAFWMLGDNISQVGWPACGEIDIMEHINSDNEVFGTIHWQDGNGNYASYSGEQAGNFSGYRVYAIEWDDQAIKWFIDGQQFHEVNIAGGINGTEEFHKNQFLLLNFAIGGRFPGWNIDESRLPARFLIDYVRVYQRGSGGGGGGGGGGGNNFLQLEAERYSAMNGIATEPSTEGGENVGYIDPGDWFVYNGLRFPQSGFYEFEYRVASPNGGLFSSDLNGGSTVLGKVSVPATGGWQNWTSVRQTVWINAGTYDFGLYALQAGWNINWIRIRGVGSKSKDAVDADASPPYLVSQAVKSAIYPTLTRGPLSILPERYEPGMQISITDLSGRIVRTKHSLQTSQLDVSDLPAGMYVLTLHNGAATEQHRFVRQ